jgi:(1->4)-alpha-D-glucan 1-alpha-D-glucosylmutase
MIIPRATYRLQFHRGFTLRDGLELVPYLSALGVSHVHASPLLQARPGSTHGYDVCDPTRINPEVGTEADLEAFAGALRERQMGLVLDIVPNHMAAAPENPWWWDVLKYGRGSRFADYFDIDWNSPEPGLRGKVLLPVLGDELERVLERGELKVVCENVEVTVRYFEHHFPASPESILVPGKFLDEAVAELNSDRPTLARFLDQQHYRLAFWRLGDTQLNYRRFFTITHLVGLRVELPQVFADTHNHILDWHQRGLLDGLRVDHPDGLRDPLGYLQRLHRAAPGAWIVVEKILEPGEGLPADWRVAGTTGYDFLTRATGIFVDPAGETRLTDFYAEYTGEPTDYVELVWAKKRWMLRDYFATEVNRLVRLLAPLLALHAPERAAAPEGLRDALVELIACFPVYRTYCQAAEGIASEADKAVVSEAVAQALRTQPQPSPSVLAFLCDLLQLRLHGELPTEFVMRFQQLTGPAMAKGAEDTAFYCYSRFIVLNEVGGDPGCFGVSVEDFHQAFGQARQQWPATMLSTSTHDTKRSDDVRARLAVLSEIPEHWMATVRRWSSMNERFRRNNWPDRNAEYLIYQTLIGAWPLPLDRALACLEKAAREAKQHTNWSDRNAAYEAVLNDFVTGTLSDRTFMEELERFVAPLVPAGFVNSLAQTLLKLTAPGVPDIYQGTDLWDFSLVDPDNRRPVDFARRRKALAELQQSLEASGIQELVKELIRNPGDGRIKLFLIQQTLQFRREHPGLFQEGSYVPVLATGPQAKHVCAFARTMGGATAIVVVPRLVMGLTAGQGGPPVGEAIWQDTQLVLPKAQAGRAFQDVFTGKVLCADANSATASLRLADVLSTLPVALLARTTTPDSAPPKRT